MTEIQGVRYHSIQETIFWLVLYASPPKKKIQDQYYSSLFVCIHFLMEPYGFKK